jgi:hypothetical protein
MEIVTFLGFIETNPACYFIAGLVLGYFLRGFILNSFISEFRSKRTSRYQSKKLDSPVTRPNIVAELNEPAFDWSDATVKTIASRRFGSIPLNRPGNEV